MPVTLIGSMPDFKRAVAVQKLTICDFFASWCGPCKAIAPKLDSLSSIYSTVQFIKINVDDLPDVAADYQVTGMPTFKFFKGGKVIDTVVGANATELEAKIKKHLTPVAAPFSGQGRTLGSAASPTSPTASSPTSSSSSPPFAASSAGASGVGSSFANSFSASTAGATTTTPASAGISNNNVMVWIAVAFLFVYWWMNQKNRPSEGAGGFEL
ncbi:thioredoxin-like protein [Blastocladiella britannica]|nr:thioredoxin-like protein [Blastocladiella britannica]